MRHARKIKKLGRPTDQRMALLKNQVTQLFLHGQIKTTEPKAWATKRLAEKTLTTARKDNLEAKPEFTAPERGDFTLQGASPLIDAGIDVGLPFNGAAPDIGAFEAAPAEQAPVSAE